MFWIPLLVSLLGTPMDARSALFGGLDFAAPPTAFLATPSVLTRVERPSTGVVVGLWNHRLWRHRSGMIHLAHAWQPGSGTFAGIAATYGQNGLQHTWATSLGGALAYRWRRWHLGVALENRVPPADSGSIPPLGGKGGLQMSASAFYRPPEIRYGLFGAGVRRISLWRGTRRYWAGFSLNLSEVSTWLPWLVGGFVYRPESTRVVLAAWHAWPLLNRLPWQMPWVTTGLGLHLETENLLNPRIAVALGLRSFRRTATDLDLQYTGLFHYRDWPLNRWEHRLSLVIAWGDASRARRERQRQAQEQQRRMERLQRLEARLQELEHQQQRLAYEWEVLEQAREQLQRERQSVEQARRQLLQAHPTASAPTLAQLDSLPGLEVHDEDSLIRLRATEQALRFEPGGTALPVSGILVLRAIAEYLRAHPKYRVRIVGHTDNVPLGRAWRKKYRNNQGLSLARARTVRDYFVKVEGLPADRFEVRGLGASQPLASNDTEAGRARNRRVEILLLKPQESQKGEP